MRLVFTILIFLATLTVRAEKILFAANFSKGITNGWKNVDLFKQCTDYQVKQEGTNFYIHAVADNTCSALTARLNLRPPHQLWLRWRWRIQSVNTNGSERELSRFDHAARVFVAFDTFLGPPRTLNYFWANTTPAGEFLEHPMTSRAEIITVESGNAKAGQWVSEQRDLTADWQRAFPGKSMPKIVGIGMLTDGDSLKTKLTGDYAGIELIGE